MPVKQKVLSACAASVLVLFGICAIYETGDMHNPAMPQAAIEQMPLPQMEDAPVNTASATAEAEEEALDGGGYYVLKAYMQRLAVYRIYPDGTKTLANIIDMDVNALPAQDIKSLEEGIVVRNNEALIRILEDFMS